MYKYLGGFRPAYTAFDILPCLLSDERKTIAKNGITGWFNIVNEKDIR